MNFVALVSKDDKPDIISSSDSKSETEQDVEACAADIKTEYRTLFDKFTELSLENLQLIKDRALLKEKEDRSVLVKTISDQAYSLKNLETRFDQTQHLLSEELEKSQLLQRELSENYKKLRMLNTGPKTLDHKMSQGQSPAINRGLGYLGSTSHTSDVTKGIKFVKSTQPLASTDRQEVTPPDTDVRARTQRKITTRQNGCLFCCKPGHKATNCYFRRSQHRRAWTMNQCFLEPSKVRFVWIAKTDLYPNYGNRVTHQMKTEGEMAEPLTIAKGKAKQSCATLHSCRTGAPLMRNQCHTQILMCHSPTMMIV